MISNKKAIGAVVATGLLLVVAVVGVVTFQTWFNTYSSSLQNEVESQSSTSLNTRIDRVVGDILYFRNGGNENISIDRVVVGGQDCDIAESISSGMNNLNLGNCTSNISESVTDVVVYTDKKIYSQEIFLDSISSNTGNSFSLDCSSLPGKWSRVPGNDDLNTSDFCVMTYEAKATNASEPNLNDSTNMYCGNGTNGGGNGCPTDGSVNVTSKAESLPLTQVYQTEARFLCSNLGSGYSLITDAQWVTMARNIENQPENWNSSIIGEGFMWVGHNDENPANLLSVSDTQNSYSQTGDTNTGSCDGSSSSWSAGSSYACEGQKRTLIFSNGDSIWDMSGNAWEWTNDTIEEPDSGLGIVSGTDNWYEWTDVSGYDYLQSYNSTYDYTYGVGRVYADDDGASPSGTTHAFRRSGDWRSGPYAGVFTLSFYDSPSASRNYISFRCTYTS